MKRLLITLVGSALVFSLGCGRQPGATPPGDAKSDKATAGDHHHGSGPHGGVIADWGGGMYHVEFIVDHDKQESVVYVLGSDAKTDAPVRAEKLLLDINEPQFQVELSPLPQAGEPEGASSRFVGKHESLGKVQEFAGTITGEVEGTPYSGEFKEEPAQ
ncbi:MAG TPA: hypothetical protein VFB96_21175 [Pirellulaceae bacterium]|jgi:hypothetical protein|nr:hypothetical protein [Pirellulaceae bacterium]